MGWLLPPARSVAGLPRRWSMLIVADLMRPGPPAISRVRRCQKKPDFDTARPMRAILFLANGAFAADYSFHVDGACLFTRIAIARLLPMPQDATDDAHDEFHGASIIYCR